MPGRPPRRERSGRSKARRDAERDRSRRRRLRRRRATDYRSDRPRRGGAGHPRRDESRSGAMSVSLADLRGEMERRGALLEGHFKLSSGRHSDRFVQKFRILEDPRLVEVVAKGLAERLRRYDPTIVVSAAGATVAAAGIIVRREPVDVGVPTVALLDIPVASYDPAACPLCGRSLPLEEPGSRFLSK